MNSVPCKLPVYQLAIENGQYPFKNAHISKIFEVSVWTDIEKNRKNVSKIIQIINSIQHPFLINILTVQQISQTNTKIRYQYIDTSIAQYIRRSLNSNIQIKLQKFYMELRNLANKFVMKNINVLNAIDCKNIGVKMANISRQSLNASTTNNKKDIVMPDFKVYIDIGKCEIISKMSDVARLMIQTDKMIYTKICSSINQLYKKIEAEQMHSYSNRFQISQSRNKIQMLNQSFTTLQSQVSTKNQDQITQIQLGFSDKIKKRKRTKADINNNKIMQTPNCQVQKIQQTNTFNERSSQRRNSLYSSQFFSRQINSQVQDIVQRSRKTLQHFKLLIKNKN